MLSLSGHQSKPPMLRFILSLLLLPVVGSGLEPSMERFHSPSKTKRMETSSGRKMLSRLVLRVVVALITVEVKL